MPTSLGLDEETVDRLVAIGRRLLRESESFQQLLAELTVPPLSQAGPGGSSTGPVRFEPAREADSAASSALLR